MTTKTKTARAATKTKGSPEAAGPADPVVLTPEQEREMFTGMTAGLTSSVEELSLAELRPDPLNRVLVLDEQFLASVKEQGVLVPILVRPVAKTGKITHEIVAGARRFAAAQQAGHKKIRCVIAPMSDARAAMIQATENLRRRNLTPREECQAVVRVIELGCSVELLAEQVGEEPQWVRDRMAMLALPDEAFDAITERRLTVEVAIRALEYGERGLKAGKGCGWYGNSLSGRLDDFDRQAVANKTIQSLKSKGVTVVKSRPNEWGAKPARQLSALVGDDKAAAKRHAKLACHVVFVEVPYGTKTARQIAYCTDPAGHEQADNDTGIVAKPQQRSGFQRELTVEQRYRDEMDPAKQLRAAWRAAVDPTAKPPAKVSAMAVANQAQGAYRNDIPKLLGAPVDCTGWRPFAEWIVQQKPAVIWTAVIAMLVDEERDAERLEMILQEYDIAVPKIATLEEWAEANGLTAKLHAERGVAGAALDKLTRGEEIDGAEWDAVTDRYLEVQIVDALRRAKAAVEGRGEELPVWLYDMCAEYDVVTAEDGPDGAETVSGDDGVVVDAEESAARREWAREVRRADRDYGSVPRPPCSSPTSTPTTAILR